MTGRKDQLSVLLSGGFPWGFRLQGGAGTGLPLVVSKVRRKSKAYKRLCEGDLILSVNGKPCHNLTYDQVMEIADKSGTDLTLQVLRQESDKENLAPQLPASSEAAKEPLHSVTKLENGSLTNEVLSVKETSTKITKETEGMRIKSAVLLPDIDFAATDKILENFTSTKLMEDKGETAEKETTCTEPFPPFSELLQTSQGPPKPPRSPIDLSTSSKTEEVSQDDNTYIKTTTERKHEVVGNKEISYVKQEQESVSKSSTSPVPDITLDTIDLNNLISATQKRLDSFKNGFAQETPVVSDALSSTYEVKKTEISSSTALMSESKTTEMTNSVNQSTDSALQDIVVDFKKNDTGKKIPPPPPPKPKIRPLSESYAQTFKGCLKEMEMKSEEQITASTLPKPKVRPLSESFAENLKDCLKELETDLNATSGDTGFTSTSNESSCVTTESPFGITMISKKKKMFSSSSFYEEPHSIYPTVEEQVEMARKIASSLADDTNKKSKGSNMFYKRVKRSSKWIHEGPDPSDESAPGTPEVQNIEPPTPDPSQVPFKPSKGPPKLKLVLDPRHPLDVQALRSSGYVISEHNVVSPEVCHDLVKDLQSPVGKGAALFAKRKKKSEEWVVDEEKVKTLLREQEKKSRVTTPTPPFNQYSGIGRPEVKLVKTPWEAAMENPYGLCDAAFARVSPDELADTVIKAADNKRRNSITTNSREPSRLEGRISPPAHVTPAAAYYDIYHAKAPKGWSGTTPIVDNATVAASTAPVVSRNIQQDTRPNGYTPAKKMVFQNFNATPRLWKGTSAY